MLAKAAPDIHIAKSFTVDPPPLSMPSSEVNRKDGHLAGQLARPAGPDFVW